MSYHCAEIINRASELKSDAWRIGGVTRSRRAGRIFREAEGATRSWESDQVAWVGNVEGCVWEGGVGGRFGVWGGEGRSVASVQSKPETAVVS